MPKTNNTGNLVLISSIVLSLGILGTGYSIHSHAATNIADDKIQVATLHKTIKQTVAQNKKLDAQNKSRKDAVNKGTENDQIQKETNDKLKEASTNVLNYLKALEAAKSPDDFKAINKTYLTADAALPLEGNSGGDAGNVVNGIFGHNPDDIHTTASAPSVGDPDHIKVYATSTSSPSITFTAMYNLTEGKIDATSTYSLTK